MWVKTTTGRYYNLARADGLFVKEEEHSEFLICMYIGGKVCAIGRYTNKKEAQENLNYIFNALVDTEGKCVLYDM